MNTKPKYAKFIDNSTIEIAPLKKDGIVGFCYNKELCLKDGYDKLLILSEQKSDYYIYKVEGNLIIQEPDLARILEKELVKAHKKAIEDYKEKQVLSKVQALDDAKALDNMSVFPLWKVGISVDVGDKYQYITGTEVRLYKAVQAHTTQTDWAPESTPALWTRIGYENEILKWLQPSGLHDAYNLGDKVMFNGNVYESLVDANVYSPATYPQGWKLY